MTRRIVIARAVAAGLALAILLPGIALGHTLNAAYTSRLPLAVYLAGAAMTVALSFVFVILRDVRVELPAVKDPGGFPPAWLRSSSLCVARRLSAGSDGRNRWLI